MRRVLLDDDLDRAFRRRGFVVLPLLSLDEVNAINAVYDELSCGLTQGWHTDMYSEDRTYRRLVHERVGRIFNPVVTRQLDRYRAVTNIFVVKEPTDEGSEVPIHQDWTIVDPDRFIAVHAICMLTDTNATNGWLMVYPGSHHPPSRISYAPHDDLRVSGSWREMERHLEVLPMKAGEAILYDGRLLHGSPPNRSGSRRVALSAGFIPMEAELLLHYYDPANADQFEVLALPDEFFITHRLGGRPESYEPRGIRPFQNRLVTEAQLLDWSLRSKDGAIDAS